MEDGERRSQSHSGEYDWLGPDPMQNTQEWLYPYIAGSFNYYNKGMAYILTNNCRWSSIKFSAFCEEVIIICICSVVQRATLPCVNSSILCLIRVFKVCYNNNILYDLEYFGVVFLIDSEFMGSTCSKFLYYGVIWKSYGILLDLGINCIRFVTLSNDVRWRYLYKFKPVS